MQFGREFEARFLARGGREPQHRATLNLGWEVLSVLPRDELTRVSEEEIKAHYRSSGRGI